MNNEEIIEGNKLIKQFMEIDTFTYDSWKQDQLTEGMYHFSWDWLMPVRRKIIELFETDSILIPFEITSHYVNLWIDDDVYGKFHCIAGCYLESVEETKFSSELEALWYVCVEFIKWWNENKKE